MTSTSINVGLNERKNSSRVLKPPGGGHSDIFGIKEGGEVITPNKRRGPPPSTINSCFSHEEFKPKEDEPKTLVTNGKTTQIDENDHDSVTQDENTEPSTEIKEEQKQVTTPEPPKRVRVPPGGFSSALW